ncbi:MAG: hypothetical protein HFI63_10295 [Lachnospiraceae bacterium]|nr:hypothetical protein [Lachnospiraceae bacterium]
MKKDWMAFLQSPERLTEGVLETNRRTEQSGPVIAAIRIRRDGMSTGNLMK